MKLSLEEIKSNIAIFKERTISLALNTVKHPDAKYLEPKELKTLTDVILNIEDSYKNIVNEGETARKINRLLSKYSSEDLADLNSAQHIVIDTVEVI